MKGHHYCKVCRQALDREINVVTGKTTFKHNKLHEHDHEPDPVPNEEMLYTDSFCDFCSAPGPKWAYHFKANPVTKTESGPYHIWGENWAACEPCAEIIELRNANMLLNRVIREWKKKQKMDMPAMGQYQLRMLYSLLLETMSHRTEMVQGIDPLGLRKMRS